MPRKKKPNIVVIIDDPSHIIGGISTLINHLLLNSCVTDIERLRIRDSEESLRMILWSIVGKDHYRIKGKI